MLVRFTTWRGTQVWINPDHVITVGETHFKGTNIPAETCRARSCITVIGNHEYNVEDEIYAAATSLNKEK